MAIYGRLFPLGWTHRATLINLSLVHLAAEDFLLLPLSHSLHAFHHIQFFFEVCGSRQPLLGRISHRRRKLFPHRNPCCSIAKNQPPPTRLSVAAEKQPHHKDSRQPPYTTSGCGYSPTCDLGARVWRFNHLLAAANRLDKFSFSGKFCLHRPPLPWWQVVVSYCCMFRGCSDHVLVA